METNIVFRNEGGVAVTTSLLVAETFGKQHKNVIQDIELLFVKAEILAQTENQQVSSMFEKTEYETPLNNGTGAVRKNPMYIMNRDGFTLLVMGYTGQKALEFKLKYIAAFNKMEQQLITQSKDMTELTAKMDTLVEQLDYSKKLIEANKEISRLNQRISQMDWEYTPHDREWWTMQAAMDPDSNLYPERMSFMEWMFDICQNPANVHTPVSANELLITWLMENDIVVTKQNLKRFRPMFRKAVEFFCQKYNYSLNPFFLFRSDRERREKAFYNRNMQTVFNGDRMVYPRQRKVYGMERCWVLFNRDGYPHGHTPKLSEPTEYTAMKRPKNRY